MFSGVFMPYIPTTLHDNSIFFGCSGVEQPMIPLRLLNLRIRSAIADHGLSFDIVSEIADVADGLPPSSGWK
jgi:hypothetical protein